MRIQSHIKEYDVIMENNLDFICQLVDMINTQFVIDEKVYQLYRNIFVKIPSNRLF